MTIRFDDVQSLKQLPKDVLDKILEQDPSLREELFPFKWTGVVPISFDSFEIVIKDISYGEYAVTEFAKLYDKKIIDLWKEYLFLCYMAGDKLIQMPIDMQKEIFKMAGLEEIWKIEVESGKYDDALQVVRDILMEIVKYDQ